MALRGTRVGTGPTTLSVRCRNIRMFIWLVIPLVVLPLTRISPWMVRRRVLFSRPLAQLFLPVFRPLRLLLTFGLFRRRRCQCSRFRLLLFLLLSVFPLRLVVRLSIGGNRWFLLTRRHMVSGRRRFLGRSRWRVFVPMRLMFVRRKVCRR